MQAFFVICFGVGVGYTVLTFLLGHTLDFFDLGGDVHQGFGTEHISPIKPIVIASFITVLGGSGLIFHMINEKLTFFVVLSLAGVCGLVVSFLLYRFIVVPLSRAQNTSTIEQHKLIGATAQVTLKIPQGNYGQIAYFINGSRLNSPAKSEDGTEINVGEVVEIVLIENNTYFVKKTNKEGLEWVWGKQN